MVNIDLDTPKTDISAKILETIHFLYQKVPSRLNVCGTLL